VRLEDCLGWLGHCIYSSFYQSCHIYLKEQQNKQNITNPLFLCFFAKVTKKIALELRLTNSLAFDTTLHEEIKKMLRLFLVFMVLFTRIVSAVRQDGNLQFSQRGQDVRVSWDEAECVTKTCKKFDNKKYGIEVRIAGRPDYVWFGTTDDLCILIPIFDFEFFQNEDSPFRGNPYTITMNYCGKRLNRKDKCKGFKKRRFYGSISFTLLSQIMPYSVPSFNVQRIKNTAFSQCAYIYTPNWNPEGAVHTWDCWNSAGMSFNVSSAGPLTTQSAGPYYKFEHVSSNRCLIPQSPAENAALVGGECSSCKAVFLEYPDSQFQNEDSNRCMYVQNNSNGATVRQWTCYTSASNKKKWELVDAWFYNSAVPAD